MTAFREDLVGLLRRRLDRSQVQWVADAIVEQADAYREKVRFDAAIREATTASEQRLRDVLARAVFLRDRFSDDPHDVDPETVDQFELLAILDWHGTREAEALRQRLDFVAARIADHLDDRRPRKGRSRNDPRAVLEMVIAAILEAAGVTLTKARGGVLGRVLERVHDEIGVVGRRGTDHGKAARRAIAGLAFGRAVRAEYQRAGKVPKPRR